MAIALATPLTPKPKPASRLCASTSALPPSRNYRPAIILPGMANNSGDYLKLQRILLKEHGVASVVANVSRIDWLRNAAGLTEPYWRGTLRPEHVLWYLKRVDEAVQQAKELANGETLSLIGHSAGGWLARVYMKEFGTSNISLLLTLGTPHLPPPGDLPWVIDQTRGLLSYVEKHCPKAVYTPQLRYVCVGGRYIRGARMFSNLHANLLEQVPIDNDESVTEVVVMNQTSSSSTTSTTLLACLVGQGYKQVCGEADVWGDGVVPEVSAYLEGALNVSLVGVCHSPVGSADDLRPWYGSPAVVQQWIHHLLN